MIGTVYNFCTPHASLRLGRPMRRHPWCRADARDGRWHHRPLLDRPGTAVVSCATTPLETTEAARASLMCPESSDFAVVFIVTTVNCGATRNSVAHKNEVFFRNPAAAPVTWRGLMYSPGDNGRKVLNGDFCAADFICLMTDLDAHLR